jgi:cytochrome c oxidase assembly protein subunit 15
MSSTKAPAGSLVTVGFGTTVAMWFAGYVGRLPAVQLASPVLLAAMLACAVGGGAIMARRLGWNPRAALTAGAISGLLNLLILGSFLGGESPGVVIPSAAFWVPGSILVTALLTLAGAFLGARFARPAGAAGAEGEWSGSFAWVAVAATALLLAVGGLVTSAEAGLAVDDWPTSFGYNMFLYPFSRMTGGVFYEHAHRLMGALVGLTTVMLAVTLTRLESRRWVRRLAWGAVVAVIAQGILGGLRVTELSLALAMTHGILAQLFFSTLVALAAATSGAWKSGDPGVERPGVRADRALSGALVGLIVIQLVLGAAQRHFQQVLLAHILTGLAIVAPACVHVGLRSWGVNPGSSRLRRLGLALAGLAGLQVMLGFGAWLATRGAAAGRLPASADLVVSTLHQWTGALLLALAVLIFCWNFRLITPKARSC